MYLWASCLQFRMLYNLIRLSSWASVASLATWGLQPCTDPRSVHAMQCKPRTLYLVRGHNHARVRAFRCSSWNNTRWLGASMIHHRSVNLIIWPQALNACHKSSAHACLIAPTYQGQRGDWIMPSYYQNIRPCKITSICEYSSNSRELLLVYLQIYFFFFSLLWYGIWMLSSTQQIETIHYTLSKGQLHELGKGSLVQVYDCVGVLSDTDGLSI
jgi:hypothetical protein